MRCRLSRRSSRHAVDRPVGRVPARRHGNRARVDARHSGRVAAHADIAGLATGNDLHGQPCRRRHRERACGIEVDLQTDPAPLRRGEGLRGTVGAGRLRAGTDVVRDRAGLRRAGRWATTQTTIPAHAPNPRRTPFRQAGTVSRTAHRSRGTMVRTPMTRCQDAVEVVFPKPLPLPLPAKSAGNEGVSHAPAHLVTSL